MKPLSRESKRIGRPPVASDSLTLRLRRTFIAKLDDWRRVQPDLPNRPEAVRRLLEKALGR